MSRPDDWSAEEARQFDEALAAMGPIAGRNPSLAALMDKWRALVCEVERGYRLTVYDYTNDLSIRDRLEEVRKAVSPLLAAKLDALIGPLDARLIDATDPVPQPLMARSGSWWRRIPRRRDAEFDTGLAAANRLVR